MRPPRIIVLAPGQGAASASGSDLVSGDRDFEVFPLLQPPALPKMTEKGIATPLEQQHAVSIHEIDRNEHCFKALLSI